MLIAGLLQACLSASMTPFPFYKGDRKKLDTLVELSGSLSKNLNEAATNMDELVSDEHLIILTRNLVHFEDFGALLSDLSASRFDDLCDKMAHALALGDIVQGYPHKESRWKRELDLPKEDADEEDKKKWCQGKDPKTIVSPIQLDLCLNSWDPEVSRRAYLEIPIPHLLVGIRSKIFDGHPEEYVQALERFVTSGALAYDNFFLPRGLEPEHLERIHAIVKKAKPFHRPKFIPNDDDDTETERLNRDGLFITLHGFDPEPFEGSWSIPDELDVSLYSYLVRERPIRLKETFDYFHLFGVRPVFEQSLEFARLAREHYETKGTKLSVDYAFMKWLFNSHVFSPRVVELFEMVRPQPLKPAKGKWHLLPLFEWILFEQDSEPYEDDIIEWAKEGLESIPARTEEEFMQIARIPSVPEAACLAIAKGWDRWLAKLAPKEDFYITVVDHRAMSVLLKGTEMKFIDPQICMALPALAITANIKLLELLLEHKKPKELLSLSGNKLVRHRLSLLMHLSPKTISISKRDGSVVDKQSTEFRRWVMLNLPCNQFEIADKKLLNFYFWNRCTRGYTPFRLFSQIKGVDHWILGIKSLYEAEEEDSKEPKGAPMELDFAE